MAPPNVIQGWHKLPQELRLEILKFAVTPPIERPAPSNIQPDCLGSPRCRRVREWGPKNLAKDLLLVSRQFHDDVQHIIKFMPNIYHLDIMLIANYGAWFTWYLPKQPTSIYIDEVIVAVRIFERPDDVYDCYKDAPDYMRRFPHPEWTFHATVLFFMCIGPRLLYEYNYGRIVVKKFDVNVLSGLGHRLDEDQFLTSIVFPLEFMTNSDRHFCAFIVLNYKYLVEGIVLRLSGFEYRRLDFERIIIDMQSSARVRMRKSLSQILEEREKTKKRFEKYCHRAQIQRGQGGGNFTVALVTRSAHKLNQRRDSLRQKTNGLLHAFPTQSHDRYKTSQKIRNNHDFKDLLKLAICNIKNDGIVPDDEMTAETLGEGLQAYKTEPEAFAKEALELIYEQNGGKTLLAGTDGVKKEIIIFTSTLGVLRRN
ncbi:unnamed protein product [Fusarium graminearum]|uniref:Uncharacterized protein n=1 Tax=Gibberella zeae TaxID=5518 RepID=A0A4E9DSD7_GIBZA|nr:unnamed protein product [Fusarium graminearum]